MRALPASFGAARTGLVATILVLLLANGSLQAQQKPQYTQYMFNGLVLNPAYAGTDECLSVTFLNRSQWSGMPGAPVTQTLSAHTLMARHRVGAGFMFVNDKIGVHTSQQFTGSLAYHLPVTAKGVLSMGLQGEFSVRKSDYGALKPGGVNDPRLNAMDFSQHYFNLGAGIYYRAPTIRAGLSAPAILPENYTAGDSVVVSWKRSQYFGFMQVTIRLTDNLELQPGFLLKYKPGLPLSYDINASAVYKKALTLGVSYRKDESVAVLLKAQVTPQLQVGYAYDMVTGAASRSSTGSHEVLVNYKFRFTNNHIASPR